MTLLLNHILSFGSPMRYNNLRLHFWRGDYCLRNQPYYTQWVRILRTRTPRGDDAKEGKGSRKRKYGSVTNSTYFKNKMEFSKYTLWICSIIYFYVQYDFRKIGEGLCRFHTPIFIRWRFLRDSAGGREKRRKERGRNSSFWSSLFLASTNGLFYSFISWNIRPYVKGK